MTPGPGAARLIATLVLTAALLFVGNGTALPATAATTPDDGHLPRAGRAPAPLPAFFVENAGQFDPAVRFAAVGAAGPLWLTDDGLWLRLAAPTEATGIRLSFDGANPAARPEPFGAQPGNISYLMGAEPGRWRTGLTAWTGVAYRQIFPGVDLEISVDSVGPRWRWLVRDGATLPATALRVDGGQPDLLPNGAARVATALGEALIAPPVMVTAGTEQDDATGGEPLVATAGPAFSTFLGATYGDLAYAVAVDPAGASYLAGETGSPNFPVTPGARDTSWNSGSDMFIAKIGAGGALVYATFLGGLGDDVARAIAVDSVGVAHIAGTSDSTNFPVTRGAFQEGFGGRTDAVVVKLDPTGASLIWSTYLGGGAGRDGGGDDEGRTLTLDAAGAVYIAGTTDSANFPVSGGALQTVLKGDTDAFVAKLNAAGGRVYATYLGGNDADAAAGLAVDAAGAAYVVGETESDDFPVTPGAAQTAYAGEGDAFVAKIGPAGNGLVWSTFVGGAEADRAAGVAIDGRGAAYVAGVTESSDFPTTTGAAQTKYNKGDSDAFVVKMNTAGSHRVFATYLGGSAADAAAGVVVDAAGVATVTGQTNSPNFPIAGDAAQVSRRGGFDAFVAQLEPASGGLRYGSYFGGAGDDYGRAIALGAPGVVVVAGSTSSIDFPATPGATQDRIRGGADAFLTRFTLGGGAAAPLPTIIEDGHTSLGATTLSSMWHFAEGFTASGFDEYLVIFNPGVAGSATITYYVEGAASPTVRTVALAAGGRTIVRVHEAMSPSNPGGLGRLTVGHGTTVTTTVPVVVERPIYFERDTLAGSHIGLGATAAAQTWLFAEGYTAPGFDEYLTILNPNTTAAPVTITYFLNGGPSKTTSLSVPATSRATIAVHDAVQGVGRGQEVSAAVTTTNPGGIVVERPIYFGYQYGGGGSTVLGATATRTSWSFAEGFTGDGFDEYLTILNPNPAPAPVTITYYLGGGQAPAVKNLTVAANSRYTVTVHDASQGVGRGQQVSAKVETTLAGGIVVERPIYFRYHLSDGSGTITGGHAVMGSAAGATTWRFAEGLTAAGADEFLTIQNPNATPGSATITYYVDGQPAPVTRAVPLAANSRTTVSVHAGADVANPGGLGRVQAGHATVIESTVPVVVERPMYLRYGASFPAGG